MNNFSSVFNNTIFIILVSTGICIWLVCLYVRRNQPKSPNSTYGYRTPAAMKSQEAWDYAQVQGTERILQASQVLCFLGVISLFFNVNDLVGTGIAVTLVLLALFIPMIITERELKDKF